MSGDCAVHQSGRRLVQITDRRVTDREARRCSLDDADLAVARAAVAVEDAETAAWVGEVVSLLVEASTILGVSMLLRPGNQTSETYAQWLGEVMQAGGIFEYVRLAGLRLVQVEDGDAAMGELWQIATALEVYGWQPWGPEAILPYPAHAHP